MEEVLILFMVKPGEVKQLAQGMKEVCGPSLLSSCPIPQALGVSMECNTRADESRVKKGIVLPNYWQGTTQASNECIPFVWGTAKFTSPAAKAAGERGNSTGCYCRTF